MATVRLIIDVEVDDRVILDVPEEMDEVLESVQGHLQSAQEESGLPQMQVVSFEWSEI